jgi:hypothetical protein
MCGANLTSKTPAPTAARTPPPPPSATQEPPPKVVPPQQPRPKMEPQQLPPPPPQQPAPPVGPPRIPTDARSLTDSLTRPGITVIEPANVPTLAPDVVSPDGRIKGKKLPGALNKLDGVLAPKPVIEGGVISVNLPVAGRIDVTISVEGSGSADGGRLRAKVDGAGVRTVEFMSGFNVNVESSVQERLDRYNRQIQRAGLEIKGVTSEGGEITIITGPRW